MITLTELETPDALPANERHINFTGPVDLKSALQYLEDLHLTHFVNMDRAYFTRSDSRYWFVLKMEAHNGQRQRKEKAATAY
ncbi:MAG: hypothetical protein AAGU05_14005 [Anaerolineaceae bacterium]